MCGIQFSYSTYSRKELDSGLHSIEHRGPDNLGMKEFGHVCIGHVRLSILDLSSAGNQPYVDRSGIYYMTYNGEIYNYLELKDYLTKKYNIVWESRSDTEVLLEGYVREGESFLAKLNGIFSFVIFNRMTNEYVALRDPLGVKPLYCYNIGHEVILASELKQIESLAKKNLTIRTESFIELSMFLYVPEPNTIYNEVSKVEPGYIYKFKGGFLKGKTYLYESLSESVEINNFDEACDKFEALFDGAVKRQMISDVPVSLFLSGGLDSSAILDSAYRQGHKLHSAYTISFSNTDRKLDYQSNDLNYAKIVANRYNINLKEIQADKSFLSFLPEIIQYFDSSFADPAAINTYLIAKEASRNGVKVMLSGQGPDEYLGGYRRHIAFSGFDRLPKLAKPALSRLKYLPVFGSGKIRPLTRRLKRLGDLAASSPEEQYRKAYTWTDKETLNQVFKQKEISDLRFFQHDGSKSLLQNSLDIEKRLDLLSLNLTYNDRMTMACGVESRVPFLDFELVKFMNSLPEDYLVSGSSGKHILKKVMTGRLDQRIINRSKAGFALPIRSWLANDDTGMMDEIFSHRNFIDLGIMDRKQIEKLRENHNKGFVDHSYLLFSLLIQQLILQDR